MAGGHRRKATLVLIQPRIDLFKLHIPHVRTYLAMLF